MCVSLKPRTEVTHTTITCDPAQGQVLPDSWPLVQKLENKARFAEVTCDYRNFTYVSVCFVWSKMAS